MNKFIMHLMTNSVFFIWLFLFISMNMTTTSHIQSEWINLTDENQLNELLIESRSKAVIIYKHSTRCGLSTMAYQRLQKGWDQLKPQASLYYLDLIQYREMSNKVSEIFSVRHQSPQVLVIKNGVSVYMASHHEILVNDILEYL